ncbi:MAG TPA: DJ-1/PfpI family protein [Polyangiaceae bacterium]|jgi:transcriptional regulator GlxA family with amidase domain|nr:DJ-1/PfpI family protein [Polyangiaceae bacterium]
MRTSSRSLAVVLFDEVALLDVTGPLEVLTTAGRTWNFRLFKVHTVAAKASRVTTRSQLEIDARTTFDELPSPELLLVPGGYGARRALSDDALVAYIARAGASATHLFGVGNGTLLLGKAGLLGDAEVSVTSDVAELLGEIAPAARPDTKARFRKEGRLLTAATPSGAVDGALRLVVELLGNKQAIAVALALGVTPPAAPGDVAIVDAGE